MDPQGGETSDAEAIDLERRSAITRMARTYTLMDLFAGCGGMTRGFVDSGRFESIFAVEMDRDAAETCDGTSATVLATDRGGHVPQADVVIGGPPVRASRAQPQWRRPRAAGPLAPLLRALESRGRTRS